MNTSNAIGELVANSIDNDATYITIDTTNSGFIKFIDNGKGISKEDFENNIMHVYKSHHNNEQSCGVSGVGTTLATKYISKNTTVKIISFKNNQYNQMTIPWGEIYKKGTLENVLEICEINEEEGHHLFEKYSFIEKNGTIIEFVYDEQTHDCIMAQFEDRTSLPLVNRLGYIFGQFNISLNLLDTR